MLSISCLSLFFVLWVKFIEEVVCNSDAYINKWLEDQGSVYKVLNTQMWNSHLVKGSRLFKVIFLFLRQSKLLGKRFSFLFLGALFVSKELVAQYFLPQPFFVLWVKFIEEVVCNWGAYINEWLEDNGPVYKVLNTQMWNPHFFKGSRLFKVIFLFLRQSKITDFNHKWMIYPSYGIKHQIICSGIVSESRLGVF